MMSEATYKIIRKLGEGSGGIVYLAYHNRLQTQVVLKEIKHNQSLQASRREVDILKNLHHRYLPQVYDFFVMNGKTYTAMSYIPGESLQEVFKKRKKFDLSELIKWGMQISSALYYLHTQNPPIVHSDIKPGNIMLTPEGDVCLIDFNISFLLDGTTMLGYTKGYSSPEQTIIATSRDYTSETIDAKSDIFSLGATFYYLATGKKFDIKQPDFKTLKKNTSEAFTSLIKKALSYKKENRFQNAREMFQAFREVPKKDKGYDLIVHTHHISQGIAFIILIFSIILCGFGVHRLNLEKVQKYNDLVAKQEQYRIERNFDEEEKIYQEAHNLLPGALESYYQKTLSLFDQNEYQKCIDFIEYDVLQNEDITTSVDRIADFYYVEGNCYYYIEEYDHAVESFEKMITYNNVDKDYYRDYIVALAYNGENKKANDILDEAIDQGMKDDSVYFSKAEISKSLSEDDDALENFKKCINITENTELLKRSYILMSDIYVNNKNYDLARDCLLDALDELPENQQIIAIERLIQVDIDMGNKYGDASYQKEAITYLEKVIENKWDTYSTYDTLVVQYTKIEAYSKAKEYLDMMETKYGIDYNIYKRYAFIEVYQQSQKANESRNYNDFENYYQQAKSLYSKEKTQNDAEMSLLEETYRNVVAGGWLS